ncbi:MAG: TPM domain-containing protein [Methylacidiphilales bacterium]|nr:TPM domain-containing protein [Candidatus Methylacidiphilales bacterium]
MKLKHFLNGVEHERVLHAIRAAEQGTTGDIVLLISHRRTNDPLAAAHKAFGKLHLKSVGGKNSLLIFVAPESQKFAVVGGTALHEKVGQKWWDDLMVILAEHFKEARYTEGLLAVLNKVGQAYKNHFPAATAQNRKGRRDIIEENARSAKVASKRRKPSPAGKPGKKQKRKLRRTS